MKPMILFTNRLVLRRAHEKDSENLFREYFSDSYSSRFLTRKPHNHTDQTNAVIQWLISQKNIKKIWTVCDLLNEGSIKVLEKLGFKREKILEKELILPFFNDSPRDCYMYSYIKI